MLNPFPHLLVLSFFAPTLLRLMVGLVFVGGALMLHNRRKELAAHALPIVGKAPGLIFFAIGAHAIIGGMLVIGYYTQIAALLGIVAGIKGTIWAKRYPRLFPFCRLEYGFIIVICLSLLITGAGALAVDLPL